MAIASVVQRVLDSARADGIAAEQRTGPSLFDRTAWRDAARVWGLQLALVVVITYLGRVIVLDPNGVGVHLTWGAMFQPWVSWDAAIYGHIAQAGYDSFWETRFLPLLPALEHLFAPLYGGNPAWAGVVISNLSALGAFGLLRVLVEREWGADTARRAILYLALFPTSFFFNAAYAEAPYVLLCVGAFLALRKGHWVVAGLLAGSAALTRPVGILLLVPIAIEVFSRVRAAGRLPQVRESAAIVGGLALPVIALGGYSLYLDRLYGSLTAIIQAQNIEGSASSGKAITWPWIGFARAANAFIQHGLNPSFFQLHILLDAAFTIGLIVMTIATIKRLPLPYVGYCWVVLALILCTPGHNWYGLYSNMRFILEVFPVFIVLAMWGARAHVERWILITFLPLLTLLTLTFALIRWVA